MILAAKIGATILAVLLTILAALFAGERGVVTSADAGWSPFALIVAGVIICLVVWAA